MVKQAAGRDALNDFAPKFAALNDDVLFGEVWSREGQLPLKLRSIITITALISKGITDSSLTYHLTTAKQNGVTKTEMAEILTHLAFYAGWPNAWAAFRQAKEVYADDGADANGDLYGYGVAPDPKDMSENKNAFFSSGKVAMLVSTASVQRQFTENMRGENSFDVAPMLVYKEYSADGTEVLVHGAEGAHSGSVAIVMNANTRYPNASWLFMEYIASKEGQEIQAEQGFACPYYESLAYDEDGAFLNSAYAADNAVVFARATAYETPGDWWYLKDKKWIDDWAGVLNTDVRNGDMSLTDFYRCPEYLATQSLLNEYTKK